jgi:type II secretory pathway pseudopilin PulG
MRGNATAIVVEERGYAMAALLVAMTVMAIVMATAMPTWRTMMKREREAELVFRGEQYGRAIGLFQRKYGNAMPPNVDALINEKFLRKKYKDPITGEDFQIVAPGTPLPGQGGVQFDTSGRGAGGSRSTGPSVSTTQPTRTGTTGSGSLGAASPGQTIGGGVLGVVSRSTDTSMRLYNGRDKYNEWVFMGTQLSNTAGAGGNNSNLPGQINQDGRGGRRGNNPDGRNANPFDGLQGGGGRGPGARGGQQQPARPGGNQPLRPGGGQQQPQSPGPRSPFGAGRSPF